MTLQLIIAGLVLVLVAQGWLWMVREFSAPGKHAVRRFQQHEGWEGREDELRMFTAAFLIEKHASPRWPVSDQDTQEIPVVSEVVPA